MTRDILLADIGGSNCRFALTQPGGRPRDVIAMDNDEVSGFEGGIAKYLDAVGGRPSAAVLAIAGAIEGEELQLTNRPSWRTTRLDLAKRFGFADLRVINDFAAVAWALPLLGSADIRPIGGPATAPLGPKVVLGPGTGLGVAALVPVRDAWDVIASEGGHATLGPREPEEDAVFARLRAAEGPVSVETILSGSGLVRLARAVDPQAPSSPEAIVAAALGRETRALETVRMFVRILGRVSGDLALIFKATGGVYLAGGLGRGLGEFLHAPEFRRGFEDHPPYEALLAGIPTLLITYEEPGLLGCAALAATLEL